MAAAAMFFQSSESFLVLEVDEVLYVNCPGFASFELAGYEGCSRFGMPKFEVFFGQSYIGIVKCADPHSVLVCHCVTVFYNTREKRCLYTLLIKIL